MYSMPARALLQRAGYFADGNAEQQTMFGWHLVRRRSLVTSIYLHTSVPLWSLLSTCSACADQLPCGVVQPSSGNAIPGAMLSLLAGFILCRRLQQRHWGV